MTKRAPRPVLRFLRGSLRGARLASCVLWAGLATAPAFAQDITSARYTKPTDRYAHGVLGDAIEWGTLEIGSTNNDKAGLGQDAVLKTQTHIITLPLDHVFEDVAPRLVDVDNDGDMEVMVVESDVRQGAALALYDAGGKITETPHIGTRNRWLAPVGAADLDGDGLVEVAFVDRPHLAKSLRIWRYQDRALTLVAALDGLTNHRIGERDIAGGIRTCNGAPEMIVASANWSQLVAVTWQGEEFDWTVIGSDTSRPAFARAMDCAG
ncbi:FG-GAP repeat domain-containing protein [Tateyamaria sp.]|uniref:FG-GAP repeat domain-containing protein n=1 Tax=Tateyamaria sp. TaxID=1929288 RepID=UPI00329BC51A